MPHNQLGTLKGSRYFQCEAAYHYIRWLVSRNYLCPEWLTLKIVHIQNYKINYPIIFLLHPAFAKALKKYKVNNLHSWFYFHKSLINKMCICCVVVWCVRKHLTERRVIWTGCLRRTGSGSENYSKTTARICPRSYRGLCTLPGYVEYCGHMTHHPFPCTVCN